MPFTNTFQDFAGLVTLCSGSKDTITSCLVGDQMPGFWSEKNSAALWAKATQLQCTLFCLCACSLLHSIWSVRQLVPNLSKDMPWRFCLTKGHFPNIAPKFLVQNTTKAGKLADSIDRLPYLFLYWTPIWSCWHLRSRVHGIATMKLLLQMAGVWSCVLDESSSMWALTIILLVLKLFLNVV